MVVRGTEAALSCSTLNLSLFEECLIEHCFVDVAKVRGGGFLLLCLSVFLCVVAAGTGWGKNSRVGAFLFEFISISSSISGSDNDAKQWLESDMVFREMMRSCWLEVSGMLDGHTGMYVDRGYGRTWVCQWLRKEKILYQNGGLKQGKFEKENDEVPGSAPTTP